MHTIVDAAQRESKWMRLAAAGCTHRAAASTRTSRRRLQAVAAAMSSSSSSADTSREGGHAPSSTGQAPIELHVDKTVRAVVHTEDVPWVPSPSAGVFRRMIERKGGEVARATTIVRFDPHTHFSRHTHAGGEEFLGLTYPSPSV